MDSRPETITPQCSSPSPAGPIKSEPSRLVNSTLWSHPEQCLTPPQKPPACMKITALLQEEKKKKKYHPEGKTSLGRA